MANTYLQIEFGNHSPSLSALFSILSSLVHLTHHFKFNIIAVLLIFLAIWLFSICQMKSEFSSLLIRHPHGIIQINLSNLTVHSPFVRSIPVSASIYLLFYELTQCFPVLFCVCNFLSLAYFPQNIFLKIVPSYF